MSGRVAERMGQTVGTAPLSGDVIFPNGATLDDGLAEEEAVLIALWNNAAFQELLTDLGVARGDLVQAGLLPNPEVIYFFEVPAKPFKYALEMPLEAFWLRPIRIAAAWRESQRVCDRITQTALDLIRDVRQAYADVLLAHARLDVAKEGVRLRGEIARLAAARLRHGDIGPQEEATARIDALQADQDAARIAYDVGLAEERLRNLLAIGADRSALHLHATPPPRYPELDADALTALAVAARPDAMAAQEFAAAAAERLRLSRLVWFRFMGILDATSGRATGHEFGPAARLTLPIFNWNQGNIDRAKAELERAERQRLTVRNQIILDVHVAHLRYDQARAEIEILDDEVRPEVEKAVHRAQVAYEEGNTAYFVVLETTRQLLDSRLREAQLQAELRRSWAELERSVGRHIEPPSSPPPPAHEDAAP